MKTIKNVIISFSLLIIAGLMVTFFTRYIISQKREKLYAYKDNNGNVVSTAETTLGVQGGNMGGPMSDALAKEELLDKLKAEEAVIADLWAGISDDGSSSSAMKVALYERNYWASQLDSVFKMYYDILSPEEAEILKQEENSFMAERESLSQDAAKAAGETFTGLQYSKEYARLTKAKTYALIERYFKE